MALVVLTSRLRDPVQGSCGFRQRALDRQITQRDNPDKPFITVHYVLNCCIRPFPLGDTANRDVTREHHPCTWIQSNDVVC